MRIHQRQMISHSYEYIYMSSNDDSPVFIKEKTTSYFAASIAPPTIRKTLILTPTVLLILEKNISSV